MRRRTRILYNNKLTEDSVGRRARGLIFDSCMNGSQPSAVGSLRLNEWRDLPRSYAPRLMPQVIQVKSDRLRPTPSISPRRQSIGTPAFSSDSLQKRDGHALSSSKELLARHRGLWHTCFQFSRRAGRARFFAADAHSYCDAIFGNHHQGRAAIGDHRRRWRQRKFHPHGNCRFDKRQLQPSS